jgi:hypothetical protein
VTFSKTLISDVVFDNDRFVYDIYETDSYIGHKNTAGKYRQYNNLPRASTNSHISALGKEDV